MKIAELFEAAPSANDSMSAKLDYWITSIYGNGSKKMPDEKEGTASIYQRISRALGRR